MSPSMGDNHHQEAGSPIPEASPSQTTPSKKVPSRWETLSLDTWFWEIFAVSFSLLCVIAILCILLVYDGKASPSLPHELTLNTIVSVLATASKSSLLFAISTSIGQLKWAFFRKEKKPLHHLQSIDEASHGPLGSFVVLYQHKGSTVICLGAVVTILALAFDPFVQQILSYPVRQVPGPVRTAFVKQVIYPFDPSLNRSSDIFDKSYSQATSNGFQDALNAGIWSSDFRMDPVCPSGNCTFSPFRSTGWCSKCEDVTSEATLQGCHNIQHNNHSTQTQSFWCNVTLPDARSSESQITVSPAINAGASDYTMQIPTRMVWSASPEFNPIANRDRTYVGVKSPLLVLGHAELEYSFDLLGPVTHPENGLKLKRATECAIAMCSRTYNISVSDGIPSTSTSAPDYGEIFNHEYLFEGVRVPTPCWKAGHGPAPDLTWMGNNGPAKGAVFKNATEFAVCPIGNIASLFIGSFVTTMVQEFSHVPDYGWTINAAPRQMSQTLQRIQRVGFARVLDGVSASLTKHALDASSQAVDGVASKPQVYVAVRWRYLTLPATVLGLGILFVVIAILQSRGDGLSLWKTSILAALYHGLDQELLADDEQKTLSSMERTAESVSVQLEYSDSKNKLMLQ